MLDRERIENAVREILIVTARCEECGKYVHRWQPAVYTSDGGIHHYGCLEDKYRKGAEK